MRDHFQERGFPSGRSAADAAFNALYNALWVFLKQSTTFLYLERAYMLLATVDAVTRG
jgi:hypothetical protein